MTWEEFKENLKNKTFLIGITFVDENGDIIDEYQTSGKVLELTDNGILKLKRENENFFKSLMIMIQFLRLKKVNTKKNLLERL
ncbi:hypothetical protein LEQ04_07530 [Riemerella anatipestifer]|nr:hypothetical protein LEQ04_07530 [Riemerella anatipestifer]